jgi:hypothetical protein
MALIDCHECGQQISDQARACPNCGYSTTPGETQQLFVGIAIFIKWVIFIGVPLFILAALLWGN